jgi:hypothetical protein
MAFIEIEIERDNQAVRVSARGSRGERVAPFDLAPVNLGRLTGLASGVRRAVATGQPLPAATVTGARELYAAFFRDQLRDLAARLGEAARAQNKKLLLRLFVRDGELQRFPWEVMCRPDTARDFVGCLPDLMVARGVDSPEPHEQREVRHAVKLLAISPLGEDKLLTLRAALSESIADGSIEWLDPIVGEQTRGARLFERLRRSDEPNVIHWIGHGGADEQQNPCLYLVEDAAGDADRILAETLAHELRTVGAGLRLVVLEACEGAKPGAFASAAELLARDAADAVLAHLWPVKADVARDISSAFYRTLVGAKDGAGDVAAALQATRRTFVERGAEVFSPVLYLRGPDPRIFDFRKRRIVAPSAPASASRGTVDPALARVLAGTFSLVVGSDGVPGHTELIRDLAAELGQRGDRPQGRHELSALAERLYLRHGHGKLSRLFQKTVGTTVELPIPPVVRALARTLRSGAHTTLLWLPFLEQAIADAHPRSTIYVIEPGPPGSAAERQVLVRRAGRSEWEEDEPPPAVDLSRDFVILRVYGGYSPEAQRVLTAPKITEDDHIQGLIELPDLFPPDWERQFVGWLRTNPLLCVGISVLEWPHRMLLRRLLDHRPPSKVSVVVAPDDEEKEIWDSGAGGLFGHGTVRAVTLALPDLAAIVEETTP